MKILYLLSIFPKISSEAFIVNEIIELKRLGHHIKISSYSEDQRKIHANIIKYNLIQDTIHYKKYSRGTAKILDFITKLFFDFIKRPLNTSKMIFYSIKYHRDIWILSDSYLEARQILSSEFDLIYVPFPHLGYLSQAFLLSKISKKPFVLTFRALDLYEKNELEDKIKLVKEAAKVNTISIYNKTNVIQKFGIKDDIAIIHSSINIDEFKPTHAEKRRKIIFIGRFVEKKGIKYLVEACHILKNKKLAFECLLSGSGPLRADYERLIEEHDLGKYITIKEPLSQEEVKQELSDSMVFVLPCIIAEDGDRDILANVLKEAMAMELAVVTSHICGIEELIENGKNGILLSPKDPQAIADAVERLFADEGAREKLGKAGREKIETDFNVQIEAKKLQRIFEEAAGRLSA